MSDFCDDKKGVEIQRRKLLGAGLAMGATTIFGSEQAIAQTPPDIPPDVLARISDERTLSPVTISNQRGVFDQVFKTSELTIEPNDQLIMEETGRNDWLAIVTQRLNFEGPAIIRRTERFLDVNEPETIHGTDGQYGQNGNSATGEGGANGEAGENGSKGQDGKTHPSPLIYILFREILFQGVPPSGGDMGNFNFDFSGLDGGNGGDGGTGGNGGRGARGRPSQSGWIDCSRGPGRGGNGGNGGLGGDRGFGANGSDGSGVLFYFGPLANQVKFATSDVSKGAGGKGGMLGKGGAGGLGGPEGRTGGNCGPAGRQGHRGISGVSCGLPEGDDFPQNYPADGLPGTTAFQEITDNSIWDSIFAR